jgi:cyclin H
MGELDFEKSTQAKHWSFDEASLLECREKACVSQNGRVKATLRPRKFASSYASTSAPSRNQTPYTDAGFNMNARDQEILVHFHAHQIQRLIGPNAVFPQLRRGASVLSTAIMLFRRFYLSNSVVDFHPRDIAAASALLAVKVDCERRLPVRSKLVYNHNLPCGVRPWP